MIVTRRFSLTNFAIATSALCFQVFVLYPWHQKLDDDFALLRKQNLETLRSGKEAQLQLSELKEIREALRGIQKKIKEAS